MTVLLRVSSDLASAKEFDTWVCLPGVEPSAALDPRMERTGVSSDLEEAFNGRAGTWWTIGHALSQSSSSELAHMPACVANASDFGLMLAWADLVTNWAGAAGTTLVVCNDPWVFRHLRSIDGVRAGRSPGLFGPQLRLAIRGYAARLRAAFRLAIAAKRLSHQRSVAKPDGTVLLVYGHPASTADGIDGYFGDLMRHEPQLGRILHTDCGYGRARELAADGRSVSLHAFGSPAFCLILPFVRWRASYGPVANTYHWLVRRSEALEGGTGQAATIRWQIHCQQRWLLRSRPRTVAWPWENHSWERAFARAAHRQDVRTVGYQHSVIGSQMLNYAPHSNRDGMGSLPKQILCTGAATRERLIRWSVPPEQLLIAGALRFQHHAAPACKAGAPVFVALPFDGVTAAEMVETVRNVENGIQFAVKDHPMTRFTFADSPNMKRVATQLENMPAVSAVIYAATSVGLEAALAGLPTYRFRPKRRIALDILPDGVDLPTIDSSSLASAIQRPIAPQPIDRNFIFAPIDAEVWNSVLHGKGAHGESH